ncbi:hypothetical protein EC957_008321 [Mortierella hygrophila]|uniref:Serine carboxypeptidase n=1 Tax=Mortierella hygrophila TaxID=979708 RepID=A0A9P6K5L8_9FUNG|nr:hypothetical protein EC957_008321 [Mortierella hygrophila]
MLSKTVGLSTIIVLTTAVAILATATTNATSSLQPPTVETWTTGRPKNDRQEHRVGPLPWAAGQDPILESYAGNFPTRQWTNRNGSKANAEMFYWFFPALKPKVKNSPLIIWLQGGPGVSSMIGLFYGTGPIHVTDDLKLVRNNNTWANEYSMLFVGQPVGTGYSFVDQGSKKRKKRKKGSARRGGERNADEGDNEDGDDTPGFDADDEEGEDSRFEELDAELERDQEEEAAFFETLPSSLPFDFKVAAASKRRRGRAKAGINTDEDPDAMYTKSGYVKDQRAVVKT